MPVLLLLFACATPPPEPEPEPEPEPASEPEPVVWHAERDPIGMWTADVPAQMKRSTRMRAFDRDAEDGEEVPEYEWIELSGRSYGELKSQVDVGWLPMPDGLEDPMMSLVSMARVPDDAEQRDLAGVPARIWTTQGALGHWTNAVLATDGRLYYLRFSDSEDERATPAHDRFFDSFGLLQSETLTDADNAAIDAWNTERDAERAAADAEPLTPAQIEANRALVEAYVLEQVGYLTCLVEPGASRQAILKISVNHGKISSIRVYNSNFSIGGRGGPTTERTDTLATCLLLAAKGWRFPDTLTASNVEVPFTFF